MPITPRRRRIRSIRIQDSDVEMDDPPQNNKDEEGDEGAVDVDGMVGEPEVDAEDPDSGDNDLEDKEEDEDEDEEDEDLDIPSEVEEVPSEVESEVEDIPSEVEEPPEKPPSLPPTHSISRLKIKIKMPGHPPSSRFDTPNVETDDDISSDDLRSRATTRPMTTRQAVLASVMDSSHVSLNETRQKKPPLNETELALRREETARKRRNLTEKKLEDEKVCH